MLGINKKAGVLNMHKGLMLLFESFDLFIALRIRLNKVNQGLVEIIEVLFLKWIFGLLLLEVDVLQRESVLLRLCEKTGVLAKRCA